MEKTFLLIELEIRGARVIARVRDRDTRFIELEVRGDEPRERLVAFLRDILAA